MRTVRQGWRRSGKIGAGERQQELHCSTNSIFYVSRLNAVSCQDEVFHLATLWPCTMLWVLMGSGGVEDGVGKVEVWGYSSISFPFYFRLSSLILYIISLHFICYHIFSFIISHIILHCLVLSSLIFYYRILCSFSDTIAYHQIFFILCDIILYTVWGLCVLSQTCVSSSTGIFETFHLSMV